jgi:ribulose bisphosphate carboxylase small subunit
VSIPLPGKLILEHATHQNIGSQGFDIGLEHVENRPVAGNNFSWWSFGENPLWVDFSKPTITGLDRTDPWPKDYVVVPAENKDGWVYLVITAPDAAVAGKKKIFAPVAHPVSSNASRCPLIPPR